MPTPVLPAREHPLGPEQTAAANHLLAANLSPVQLAWLGGYLSGLAGQSAGNEPESLPGEQLTILFGSQSGNSQGVAKAAAKAAAELGLKVSVQNLADYRQAQLAREKCVLLVISTHGDGEPPDNAVEFCHYLLGKRAPALTSLHFSVLALGDLSYAHFCQTGRALDAQLEKLGATRLYPRVDCDIDYWDAAEGWIKGALAQVRERLRAAPPAATAAPAAPAPAESPYSRRHPFPAKLLDRIVLNDTGSAKETWHLELSLAGSGLRYEPGDSLGVFPTNHPHAVAAVLAAAKLAPETEVASHDGSSGTLYDRLHRSCEISLLTRDLLRKYLALGDNPQLAELLAPDREAALAAYLQGRDLADLLSDFPIPLYANDLVDLLRKLPPRLYSIASSPLFAPEEVHLCVARVRYHNAGRQRHGVCSSYFAEGIGDEEEIPVFVNSNPNFRLPADPGTPIVMVGPGTGVAPYRAFLQHREASGAKGRNWLFFGEQRSRTDFLYQIEWQKYLADGLLTHLHVAFSRDQADKVYVQARMREHGAELYRWLEEGAWFYVCGEESRMAHDVHSTLLDIVARAGGLGPEAAAAYVDNLRKQGRYRRDVY